MLRRARDGARGRVPGPSSAVLVSKRHSEDHTSQASKALAVGVPGTSPAHLQGALLASAPFPGPGLTGCCTWGVGLWEGPWEAVWPLQGEAACFLPGTPGNSILRDLSLAFNADIFQKLPGTNATPPRL